VLSHDGGSAAAGGSSKAKNRYVFVFDKVLLLCKPTRGDHYTYKDSLKLAEYKVQDPTGGQSGAGTVAPRRWTHSFMLVHAQELNALTLFARTEEDKRKWVAAIREALATVVPPQKVASTHQPAMCTFETPTACDHCHKLLKGLFFQGYKCEKYISDYQACFNSRIVCFIFSFCVVQMFQGDALAVHFASCQVRDIVAIIHGFDDAHVAKAGLDAAAAEDEPQRQAQHDVA
jgi:hypothetical protein